MKTKPFLNSHALFLKAAEMWGPRKVTPLGLEVQCHMTRRLTGAVSVEAQVLLCVLSAGAEVLKVTVRHR